MEAGSKAALTSKTWSRLRYRRHRHTFRLAALGPFAPVFPMSAPTPDHRSRSLVASPPRQSNRFGPLLSEPSQPPELCSQPTPSYAYPVPSPTIQLADRADYSPRLSPP